MGLLMRIRNHILMTIVSFVAFTRKVRVKLGLLAIKDHQYNASDYKGLRVSETIHDLSLIEQAQTFDDFRPDDVIILTYPKTGTHFMADVVNSILYESGQLTKEQDRFFCVTALEMRMPSLRQKDLKAILGEVPSPRVFGTHLPYNFLPPGAQRNEVKVIHCMRNPKDTVCSAYPFLKRMGILEEGTTWEQLFQLFITGKIVGGSYLDFLRQWYPHRDSPNNLYFYYEDMIDDLESAVKKTAQFLGVKLTDEQVKRITEKNTFANVTKNLGNTVFHRQGKYGTWKKQLTVAQNEAMDKWIEDGMKGLDDIKFRYE